MFENSATGIIPHADCRGDLGGEHGTFGSSFGLLQVITEAESEVMGEALHVSGLGVGHDGAVGAGLLH